MIIYTDGSCHGNPGKGGWALYCPETALENWGMEERTTNNRMELTAIMRALMVEGVTKIVSDSEYCVNGCTKWVKGWVKKGWKTATGRDVKNADLWKKILELGPDRVEFQWVKAHATNEHNNYVDQLANKAIDILNEGGDTNTATAFSTKKSLEAELAQLDKRRAEIVEMLAAM